MKMKVPRFILDYGIPIWMVISTITLWMLISSHIIFPIGWEYLYNIINTIFITGLIIEGLWIGFIFKNKLR